MRVRPGLRYRKSTLKVLVGEDWLRAWLELGSKAPPEAITDRALELASAECEYDEGEKP
jgi:hypothetical protein